MGERAGPFDELQVWDDMIIVPMVADDEQDVTRIDPRPFPKNVVDIDESIDRLEKKLSALRLRRSSLLAERALIGRLPPELLSRIFELGVHSQLSLLPILSLVSRSWREATVSTPTLWSYIKLDHNWGYGRSAAFLRKIQVYLGRSQDCRLHVDIDFRYLDTFPDVILIMDALKPELHRAFSFRASVPDWDWMTAVRERSHGLGENLEELYLRIDPSDSEDQTPVTFFSGPCPRLHTIVLEHTPLTTLAPLRAHATLPATTSDRDSVLGSDNDLQRIELPALRKLHLIRDPHYHSSSRIGVPFKELVSTLVATPSLTDLRIQSAVFLLDGSETVFQPDPAPTCIPLLTSLSFNYLDTTNVGMFLESTHLPKLQRLGIQMESNNEETLHFLARLAQTPLSGPGSLPRFPSLRFLDLRAVNTDGAALPIFIRALHALPQLTALALSSPPSGMLGSKLFELLSCPCGSPLRWILPHLQALLVQNSRDVSGHEILQVVRARLGHSSGAEDIQYLRITQCYALDFEIVDQLRTIVEKVQTHMT